MSLWTKAALGAAAVAVCAGGTIAQTPLPAPVPAPAPTPVVYGAPVATPGLPAAQAAPGCASCGTGGGGLLGGGGGRVLAGQVPNSIPHCNRHTGLTQYPLSEKRYIKQFCNPTIAAGSCFGHFKTQWTPWPQACPGWPVDGGPATQGPNYTQYAPPANPQPGEPPAPQAPAPKPADDAPPAGKVEAPPPPAAPTKPLDLPPSKPAAPKGTETPAIPMPPGGVSVPPLPPAGDLLPPKF